MFPIRHRKAVYVQTSTTCTSRTLCLQHQTACIGRSATHHDPPCRTPSPPPQLHTFIPAILLEIDNLLSQSSDLYCDLDPVPTTVLKKISNAISPTILSILNLSITAGTFPSTLKSSIISPLLKRPSLNKEDLSNYRHIANLFFVSKLTEQIVKKCLLDHLTSNSLLNPFQSAYTKC